MCIFCNFGSSMTLTLTLTLDRVEVTLVRIHGRGRPTHQSRSKLEELFVDVRTDVWTDTPEFRPTMSSPADDLKIKKISIFKTDIFRLNHFMPYFCNVNAKFKGVTKNLSPKRLHIAPAYALAKNFTSIALIITRAQQLLRWATVWPL